MLKKLLSKKLLLVLALALLASTLVTNLVINNRAVPPAQAASLPAMPAGLKNPNFMLGLANSPVDLNWLKSSGAKWDARYQYLAGGANTGSGWSTWNSPAGAFASYYMNDSASVNALPVFTYYMLLQSAPASGSNEGEKNYNNLNNASTMRSYYGDFKLLMDQARAFGKPVIVHVEPDLWGFFQQRSGNPSSISASVASSGYADVAGYPNNVAGFARALVGLRDKYAPNVMLAYHISPWASPYGDLGSSTDPNFNVAGAAQSIASFYTQLGANFDLMFYDVCDRDAALYQSWGDSHRWWDVNNATYPNFNRFHQFASAITTATGKRGMLWQVPIGNTLYRSMNNTTNHWQDNRVQYYLGNGTQHIQDLAASGIVGILFGRGDGQTTSNYDAAGDGITNPAAINGNNQTASYSDDDGGYLRLQGQAYYTRPVALSGGTPGPAPTATATAAPTATPTKTTAPTATAAPTTPPPGTAANGLNAEYYNNMALSGTAIKRVDPAINFNWAAGSPGSGINADGFSARWTGQVKPLSSETYTFCTTSDDGVRLWVNNAQLVNNWTNHASTENCGQIALVKDQAVSLKMEYFENGGNAVARLTWQAPSVAKQVVPQARLFTTTGTATTPPPAAAPTATPVPPTTAAAAPQAWQITGTTGGAMTAGSTVTINASFTAPVGANGSYILDVEVYNLATGQKVAQWAPTQTATPGQVRTVTTTWQAPAGNYQVRMGVFTTGWSLLAWQHYGPTFTVR